MLCRIAGLRSRGLTRLGGCTSGLGPRRWHLASRSMSTSSPAGDKDIYITTPIFYVNAPAHIGHLYTMVLADVMKRWQVLRGRKAILSTGVDEHGLKVQKAAEAQGTAAQAFCDAGAANFEKLARAGEIDYDVFVRTTGQTHRETVQYVWNALFDGGHIYRADHSGWYSVADETFYPETQVRPSVDVRTGRKFMASAETGKEVEWTAEQNYHFRLSAFRDVLRNHYDANPGFITPQFRMDALRAELDAGLPDLSVSRPAERLRWGIPVPNDETQTIYVWLDALVNYLTTAQYPWPPGSVGPMWPPDVHVIGKDINRFHAIYWPAFLAALDVPLPSRIVSHGHWTLGRKKMSKSDGNVVNPFFALSRFGVDVVRFFLAHDGGVDFDPEYNNDVVTGLYRDVLQSVVGNLASRVVKARMWDVRDGVAAIESVSAALGRAGNGDGSVIGEADRAMADRIVSTTSRAAELMDRAECRPAMELVVAQLRETSRYFHSAAPWAHIPKGASLAGLLDGTTAPSSPTSAPPCPPSRVQTALLLTSESLRTAAILLQPAMPSKMPAMLDMLGVSPTRRTAADAALFADREYGVPLVPVKGKTDAILFPPLVTED